jgi:hypothetical protein
MVNTVLIRLSDQSLFEKGGYELGARKYVESLGMQVVQYSHSSFGACYFMEVENFIEDSDSIYEKMEADPKTFEFEKY